MILLFTDFGYEGPYVGQMKAVLAESARATPVIDLMHDAPKCDPASSAYLLAALLPRIPEGAIVVGVIDPGVGTDRPARVLEADGRRFVGPGNGLFEIVERRSARTRLYNVTWQPRSLSASFHGRDLFAPVAARLANGLPVPGAATPVSHGPDRKEAEWPDDLDRVIYVDGFGNAMTGRRAETLEGNTQIIVNGKTLPRARTFGEVPQGTAFWYENSVGLVEIAVNQASAADTLGLSIGAEVAIATGSR